MEFQQVSTSNLDLNIQKFLKILYKNEYSCCMISIPKELICFCEHNFQMKNLNTIEKFIHQMNDLSSQILDINAEITITIKNEIQQRLSTILDDDNFIKVIIENLLAMKLNEKQSQEEEQLLIPKIENVECEPYYYYGYGKDNLNNNHQYRINLQIKNPNNNPNNDDIENGQQQQQLLSFTMNREQMKNIHDEMDKIRQQLFNTVE